MKNFLKLACAASITGLVFSSCSKLDQDAVHAPKVQNNISQIPLEPAKYTISSVGVSPREELNLFTFHENPDGSLQVATQLTGETGSSSGQLSFNVIKSENQVAFVNSGKPSDTVFVAYLNEDGKVRAVKQGNAPDENFLPSSFYYENGKLSRLEVLFGKMKISSEFSYDSKGNLIKIKEFSNLDDETVTTVFGYDYTGTAGSQFYFELPTGFINNSFALLEYVGLFPELQPKNLRTSVKKSDAYSETTVKYGNHKISPNGQLLGYDIVDDKGNSLRNHSIEWKTAGVDDALASAAKQ